MRRGLILKTFGLLLLASFIVLWGQSARLLQQLNNEQINIEYADGSPSSGEAYISVNNPYQPVWLAVNWRWCPSLNPLRWCINANGDIGEAEAKVSLGVNSISISDSLLNANNLDLVFGFIPVGGSIEANIRSATIKNEAGLNAILELDATALVSDIDALGYMLSPHRLELTRAPEQAFNAEVSGDIANGNADIMATGKYTTDILLTPPEDIAGLLKNQLPTGPNGSYIYKVSGTAPLNI